MKRTQKTHARKFGGVWYQLVTYKSIPDLYEMISDKRFIKTMYGIYKEIGKL